MVPGSGSTGLYTLIKNPGSGSQTVTNVVVTDGKGNNIQGMDDVIIPGANAGTLFVAASDSDTVYKLALAGLDPNAPIIAFNGGDIGGFDEVAIVNPTTGVVETSSLTGVTGLRGMDFVAAPEP